jgi:hypothetical protein
MSSIKIHRVVFLFTAILVIGLSAAAEGRQLHTTQGRWTRRDPLGNVDSASLYEFAVSNPRRYGDALGLRVREAPGCTILSICSANLFVQQALAYHNAQCPGNHHCTDWLITCNESQFPGELGYTDCDDCRINIAPNEHRTINQCATLAHELIHSGDMCANGDCSGSDFGNGLGRRDCDAAMCSELRASFWGCCTDSDPFGTFEECFWAEFENHWTDPVCGDAVDWPRLWECCLGVPPGQLPACDSTVPVIPFDPHCVPGSTTHVTTTTTNPHIGLSHCCGTTRVVNGV